MVGARLQELGPRFTLKLRSLQVGGAALLTSEPALHAGSTMHRTNILMMELQPHLIVPYIFRKVAGVGQLFIVYVIYL